MQISELRTKIKMGMQNCNCTECIIIFKQNVQKKFEIKAAAILTEKEYQNPRREVGK